MAAWVCQQRLWSWPGRPEPKQKEQNLICPHIHGFWSHYTPGLEPQPINRNLFQAERDLLRFVLHQGLKFQWDNQRLTWHAKSRIWYWYCPNNDSNIRVSWKVGPYIEPDLYSTDQPIPTAQVLVSVSGLKKSYQCIPSFVQPTPSHPKLNCV